MDKKNYLDNLFNPDDSLGVKFFGVNGWNAVKGAVSGYVDAALKNPLVVKQRKQPSKYNEVFTKLLRPNVAAGAELLGASWFDEASDFLSSRTFNVASDIGHNVANIASYIPYVGEFVKGGRKATNLAADTLNALGFGTKAETVKTAAVGGGALLLIGGGVAIWYFGFHKNKKRGRR